MAGSKKKASNGLKVIGSQTTVKRSLSMHLKFFTTSLVCACSPAAVTEELLRYAHNFIESPAVDSLL